MIPRYDVSVGRNVIKAIGRGDELTQVRVWDAIVELGHAPRGPSCHQLKGRNAWRKRVGDYRVLYTKYLTKSA